jgi:hypothetical protein
METTSVRDAGREHLGVRQTVRDHSHRHLQFFLRQLFGDRIAEHARFVGGVHWRPFGVGAVASTTTDDVYSPRTIASRKLLFASRGLLFAVNRPA